MTKPGRGLLAALIAFNLMLGFMAPARTEAAVQTRCPVMGGIPNKRLYADYQGKRVYFCCPPCVREFQKDPGKYMTQMEKQGVVPEDAPKAENK